jgi:hypothetical protein
MRKALLIVFGLLIILSLTGAFLIYRNNLEKNNSLQAQNDSSWNTYTLPDPNSSISFKYPYTWMLSPECSNQVPLIDCVMSPDFPIENLANSSTGTIKGAYMGLRFNHPEVQGQTLINDTNTTVGGKPALVIKDNSTETVHIILSPDTDLSIFYSYDKNNEAKDLEVFNQILKGFKFGNLNESETGKVTGKLCYPSDFLPQGEIVAKDINTDKIYSQSYPGNIQVYSFDLPQGTYHLRYQAHASANNQASFTSEYYLDSNNKNASVNVETGKKVENVDLCSQGGSQQGDMQLDNSF